MLDDLLTTQLPGARPDDVIAHYAQSGCALRVKLLPDPSGEGCPVVLIEGDKKALRFLADLLLAQASDPLDCGTEISPEGPGGKVFGDDSECGLYIHSLPCAKNSE